MDRGEFAVRGGILDVTSRPPHRTRCVSNSSATKLTPSRNSTPPTSVPTATASRPSGPPPCRELQLTDAVRTRAKALVGSIPNAEDMLESIANAIPVEGMESLMPALVDHLEPVGSMLPKHAVILLSDPEKLRRSAEDLAKTANEFLAASWHVAASGHGAGAAHQLRRSQLPRLCGNHQLPRILRTSGDSPHQFRRGHHVDRPCAARRPEPGRIPRG